MNVLIIGANSQIGQALAKQSYNPYLTFREVTSDPQCYQLNIANKAEVGQLFATIDKEPNIVFLPAAQTNVDFCEQNSQESLKTNILGVKYIVDTLKGSDAILVFYSSDYIFDGKEGYYSEDSIPNPINEYGRQKLIAEHYIATNLEKYYIIRTNCVFGPDSKRKNFALRLVDNLRAKNIASIPLDEWGTPTYSPDLAKLSLALAGSAQPYGIYHIAGSQVTNRYKLALEIAKIYNLDDQLIKPIYSKDLLRPAFRPLNGGLKSTYSIESVGYEEAIKLLKEEEL